MSYWVSFWPKGETRKTESKFKLGINNRESLKSLRKGEDINIGLQDKEWRQGMEHPDQNTGQYSSRRNLSGVPAVGREVRKETSWMWTPVTL